MQTTMNLSHCFRVLFAVAAAHVLSNCAGTTPQAKFLQPMPEAARIARGDKVSTRVTSTDPGMLASDQQRLGEKIAGKIKAVAASRAGAARTYEVEVAISRYDKGSAFARAMLAGLGQIHIDGVATVYQQPGKHKIAQFEQNKTFAWGGIYGASVTMDTIEDTYAKGIAEAVCQGK